MNAKALRLAKIATALEVGADCLLLIVIILVPQNSDPIFSVGDAAAFVGIFIFIDLLFMLMVTILKKRGAVWAASIWTILKCLSIFGLILWGVSLLLLIISLRKFKVATTKF